MLILKTSDFRPAYIQATSQFLPPTQPNQFHPFTEINSSSIPHTEIKSISTTITKTKSISMLTLKTSTFRHAHKNKVIFYPRTKNKSISVLTLKPSQFLHPTKKQEFRPQHWSRVNDPHSKNKSIWRAPQHENQNIFDPDSTSHIRLPHKTKPILIPTL